jgi:hypothetical protein
VQRICYTLIGKCGAQKSLSFLSIDVCAPAMDAFDIAGDAATEGGDTAFSCSPELLKSARRLIKYVSEQSGNSR